MSSGTIPCFIVSRKQRRAILNLPREGQSYSRITVDILVLDALATDHEAPDTYCTLFLTTHYKS